MNQKIYKKSRKAVFVSPDKLICLIDSGADIPVWCTDIRILKQVMRAQLCEDCFTLLSGFGGHGESCVPVYKIPDFPISHEFIFKNMRTAFSAEQQNNKYDIILPLNLFSNCNIFFHVSSQCKIDEIRMHSLYERTQIYCLPHYSQDEAGQIIYMHDKKCLCSLGCFIQNEIS